jgi:hypothetical protein
MTFVNYRLLINRTANTICRCGFFVSVFLGHSSDVLVVPATLSLIGQSRFSYAPVIVPRKQGS